MILQNMKLLDISQSWNLKAITIYQNHFFLYGDFYCLYISNINNNNNKKNQYLFIDVLLLLQAVISCFCILYDKDKTEPLQS